MIKRWLRLLDLTPFWGKRTGFRPSFKRPLTPKERKAHNWNRYFSGQVEI